MPGDVCEVVLYSPDHDASFASLGVEQATAVVDLWAERSAALGSRPGLDYVLVFENRGAEVGATISHPHGQIYGFDVVPPRARAELERPTAARRAGSGGSRRSGGQPVGPVAGVGAVGRRAGPTRCWSRPSARCPTCPRSTPTGAATWPRCWSTPWADWTGCSTRRCPTCCGSTSGPSTAATWPDAWVHAHIAPLLRSPATPRFVASGELGSGILFNPVDPDDAAEALRRA